jgi:pimeloyl-ACP methyl ester carboxylesterase
MGAGIGGLFAGIFPDRVHKLVMIDGLGPYTTSPVDSVENLRRAIEARPRHRGRTPRRMPDLQAAIERKLGALPYLGDAAEALVRRGTRPVDGGVAFSHDPRLQARSLLRFTEEHVLAIFDEIRCPTMVIRADQGLNYPDGHGDEEARRARLADLPLVEVEVEGHHHVHLTHPEKVAPAIGRFLSQRYE